MVARLVRGRARALMVLGTASHVGKSLMTTALCRLFADKGMVVVPFKAQNMSLEAAATPEGGEIGRAQALQAEAARQVPHTDMNPVLIKPTGDRHAQVVVEGIVWADVDAWDYHRHRTQEIFPRVVAAYERLAARSELIVLEGAGSPAEINLRGGDIVNMRMAAAADASCILVVDIDRGGAFAALIGTLALLEPDERPRICGFVVNKFRGDVHLLEPGLDAIAARAGIPCLGVIPWLPELGLEEEDGYAARLDANVAWPTDASSNRPLRVAFVGYPYGANLSDCNPLLAEPSVVVRHVSSPQHVTGADLVLLPGTKSTLADLRWLRHIGLDAAITAHARSGGLVLGICGGMQMLGSRIIDPDGVEGGGEARGLELLSLETTLAPRKIVRRVRGRTLDAFRAPELRGAPIAGYEIHAGRSRSTAAPFAVIQGDNDVAEDDGAVASSGRVVGTYVHGVLDDDGFRHALVTAWRRECGLTPPAVLNDHTAQREARIDRWAAHVRAHCDVEAILALAGLQPTAQ